MDLTQITPMILTYNEQENVGRCLEKLRWAGRVLVVDSGSTDETLAICAQFPNVVVLTRPFDSFAGQCNFGLGHIATEWVLSLDCDYILTDLLIQEITTTKLEGTAQGLRCGFRYCMGEHVLRATLYPPRTVLYRKASGHYEDDGHGHRVKIDGLVFDLNGKIHHDDRKPLRRWLDSQKKYAALEAEKLSQPGAAQHGGMADRLRRMIWPAAPAAFFYTLLCKGLILDGWPGFYYVLQRTYAELLLSLELLDRKVMRR